MLDENKATVGWLGIHDIYEEGDWNTIMDEPLEATGYSKWKSDSPNNLNNNRNCGLLLKESEIGLNDQDCTVEYPFFCEINF